MKSYTDIEQSKKLAEILSLESADMHYATWTILDGEFIVFPNQGSTIENLQEDYGNQIIPCWSLAALVGILPRVDIEKEIWFDDTYSYRVKAYIGDGYVGDWVDNPIDACYNMIIELHKNKLL